MKAKIEIRTRDIQNAPDVPYLGIPQHGFLILSLSNGMQHILRAGPSGNDMLRGSLEAEYTLYNPNIRGNAASDYITDVNKYRATTIYSGDDLIALQYMNKIWEFGQKVNAKSPDYKLPLCDVITPGIYHDKCAQANSNAFIFQGVKYADLQFKYPVDKDNNPVWLPGLHADIRDTLLDHIIGYGGKYSDITLDTAREVYSNYLSQRKGIVDKAVAAMNASIQMYAIARDIDKVLSMSKELFEWQKEAVMKMHQANDNDRQTLEKQAKEACAAKGKDLEKTYPCSPANGKLVSVKITNLYTDCTNMPLGGKYCVQHVHEHRHYECNITLTCGDLQTEYQKKYEKMKEIRNALYEKQKAEKQAVLDNHVNNLAKNIDKHNLPPELSNKMSEIQTHLSGELNAVKNTLCDHYHLAHKIYA